jgi:hypothetical protein
MAASVHRHDVFAWLDQELAPLTAGRLAPAAAR